MRMGELRRMECSVSFLSFLESPDGTALPTSVSPGQYDVGKTTAWIFCGRIGCSNHF